MRGTGLRAAAFAFAAALPLLTGGCETNPATGARSFTGFMSPEQELEVGREQHPQIVREFGGEIDDAKLKAYVERIGQSLAKRSEMPDLKFTFTVLDSEITNAFALPGGYVYVTRGLMTLASSEAELAGVIGHEIGHVTARHTAQRYSRGVATGIATTAVGILEAVFLGTNVIGQVGAQAGQVYLAGFSREQEFESDTLGVRYLARAGYDPAAMSSFLGKLQAESALAAELAGKPGTTNDYNIMATHPRTQDRVREAIEAAKAQENLPANPRVDADEYLNAIDGMAYGGSHEGGFVRNRTFVHPALRFQFEVPPGFMLINSDKNVKAQGPNGAAIIFDRDGSAKAAGIAMANYVASVSLGGTRLRNIEKIEINGMEAATGSASVRTNSGPAEVRLVAIRFDSKTIYRFIFLTPTAQSAALSEELRKTTYSFRKLSEQEAANAKPLRVRVVTARAGDTVDGLARRMAFDTAQEARFRVINGLAQGATLRSGQRVKIVSD